MYVCRYIRMYVFLYIQGECIYVYIYLHNGYMYIYTHIHIHTLIGHLM